MKKSVFAISCFIIHQSCSPPHAIEDFTPEHHNVLLQESRGWPIYIYFSKDTSYYTMRQKGKPSYFTDYDTLIRISNCKCYRGKDHLLRLDQYKMSLQTFTGTNAKKTLYFATVTEKQLQTWNAYKNEDKWRELSKEYDSLLKANNTNIDKYHQIKNDWQRIQVQAHSLNQTDFESELNNFKSKYSIK